jgi:rfaE bifunctional protein kinase chain/domain
VKTPSTRGRVPDTRKASILVVGDVMLDRYWFGDVSRISPEAPVPVVLFRDEELRPGGAANVASNCAALGAKTRILSVTGDDADGTAIGDILRREGVQVNFHADRSIRTTQKLRVIGGHLHQLLRIDFETYPSRQVLAAKLADFESALPSCNAVILSDYGKGGLAHIARMITRARAAGKRVLVGPKGEDYSRYRGAHLITPNYDELRQTVGAWKNEADLARRAQKLRRQLALEALLLTRGEEGMTLFREAGVLQVKAEKHEVYDVTGAGDTVVSVVALALAAGADFPDACRLANHAAGVVIREVGTATCTPEALLASLAGVR